MKKGNRRLRLLQLALLLVTSGSALYLALTQQAAEGKSDTAGFVKHLDVRGRLTARASQTHRFPARAGKLHSLLISLPAPAALGERDGVAVTLRDNNGVIVSKTLHQGDADLYATFRSTEAAAVTLVSTANLPADYTATVLEWPDSDSTNAAIEAEPNDTWKTANEIALGQTVWASADDKPYVLPLGQAEVKGRVPYGLPPEATTDRLPEGGIDWFKLNYDGEEPRLVHFELDLLERDNLPVDVSVFTVEDNELKPYERGLDPVSPPHEVQAAPGNKFTTRLLTKGIYYLRVDANHAFYQLRTASYAAPPYTDPRQAIRAGMDYLISAGDSWHANTPRHGGLVNRVSNNHHETQLCISCHATHFTTRGELTAAENGYTVNKRWSLQFLTERLANNPRPFYGFPAAYWTNVISASANVMSRLAILVDTYDRQFTGEQRLSLLKGVAGYLKLYYKGRTVLPNDESNGNTPLVSTYEVAWYSWRVFDELAKATNDAEAVAYRRLLRSLLEQDKLKNNVDLAYQTIAFAQIDRQAYAERIKLNAERILSLQRPDGQWSMLFDPNSAAVEFQTYHSLYALALAGYAPAHPQIAKSLNFLLARQQVYGGWYDVKQSYENFGTPFRETQFAIMALSQFYPGQDAKGWPAPPTVKTGDVLASLERYDKAWSKTTPQLTGELLTGLKSAEPLVRTASAAALGRLAVLEAVAPLRQALDDRSKLVQIAAAQALRRIASRHQTAFDQIQLALNARNARARWAATRIFAQHFAYLTTEPASSEKLVEKLLAALDDPYILVRMQAAKSLGRWFYYAKDEALKDRIADAFIARLAVNEHPWMRRNLLEGVYSLADENVRYLYNNWIGHLPQQADKDQAIRGHHETSRRMAERVARALETGSELQRNNLLTALAEFHLRHGGYNTGGRYTRIGNDIEQILFYAEGAPAMERALKPLLNATDAKRRQQAVLAAYTVRDNALSDLPLLVLQKLNDADAGVRAVTNEFYKALPLKVVEQNRAQAAAVLRELLASQYSEAQIAALERLKTLGSDFARLERFDEELRRFLLKQDNPDKKTAAAALRALGDFPQVAADPAVQARLAVALQSTDTEMLRAAVQLVLNAPAVRAVPVVAAALDSIFKSDSAARRKLVLDLVMPEAQVQDDLRLVGLVADALEARDEVVRTAALNAVRRVKALRSIAAIRAELAQLAQDPNPRVQSLALALTQGTDNVKTDLRAEALLDFNFFAARIMPLLTTKGADGNACLNCHTTHAIFQLVGPDNSGRFTDAILRENYRSALRVVDLSNPENSLILRKPIGDASQEGLVDSKKTPHGGGPRWQGAGDTAYETVLEWINGAKLSVTKSAER